MTLDGIGTLMQKGTVSDSCDIVCTRFFMDESSEYSLLVSYEYCM